MIVAVHGRFDVTLDECQPVRLTTPHFGYHIPPGHSVTLDNWQAGSVAMVICSHEYDEHDYC